MEWSGVKAMNRPMQKTLRRRKLAFNFRPRGRNLYGSRTVIKFAAEV